MSKENGCPNPDCNDPDCGLAHMNDSIKEKVSSLFSLLDKINPKMKKVRVDFLTKDEITAYNNMTLARKEAEQLTKKVNTLHQKLWSDISLRINHFDGNLSIDINTTEILKEIPDDDDKK